MGGKNTFFLFWGVFKFPSKTKAKPKKKEPHMRTHNCGCFATLLAAAAAERVETYSLLLLLACVYRFLCALLTKGQNGESQRHILLDVVDDVLQSQMSRNLYTHTHEFLNNECLFFLLVCSQVYIKANQPAPYSTVY
jgi:hypothetical protein